MAKGKNKQQAPKPPTVVPNRDLHQRLNFLYQASALLAAPSPSSSTSRTANPEPSTSAQPPPKKRRRKEASRALREAEDVDRHALRVDEPGSAAGLSRFYVNTMRTVAAKGVLRIDPIVKRSLCRRCDTLLIPGVNSSVEIQASPSHSHLIRLTCSTCSISRAIPAPLLDANRPVPGPARSAGEGQGAEAVPPRPDAASEAAATAPTSETAHPSEETRQLIGSARRPLFSERSDLGHVRYKGMEVVEIDG